MLQPDADLSGRSLPRDGMAHVLDLWKRGWLMALFIFCFFFEEETLHAGQSCQ